MKKGIFLLIAPLLVGVLLIPAFSQEDMEVVDNEGFTKKQRPPAVFRHDEHNEMAEIDECSECHHIYENGQKLEDESSEDQSCSECHDEEGSGNQLGLKSIPYELQRMPSSKQERPYHVRPMPCQELEVIRYWLIV